MTASDLRAHMLLRSRSRSAAAAARSDSYSATARRSSAASATAASLSRWITWGITQQSVRGGCPAPNISAVSRRCGTLRQAGELPPAHMHGGAWRTEKQDQALCFRLCLLLQQSGVRCRRVPDRPLVSSRSPAAPRRGPKPGGWRGLQPRPTAPARRPARTRGAAGKSGAKRHA